MATEEFLRWASPVYHFRRTATRDVELGGKRIKEGDKVVMWYASGNRDEEVFTAPFAFRADRQPNPHIGFGMGEHVCLGAHLARLELRHAFGQLRERLESCEPAGPVERVRRFRMNLSEMTGRIIRLPAHGSGDSPAG